MSPRAGSRQIAFLRGINVGGHRVSMDVLRAQFESLGLEQVETFIASGNVIFKPVRQEPAALERRIEAALRRALGYDVATFLRSDEELARIAELQPFAEAACRTAGAFCVGFLAAPPDRAARRIIEAFRTDIDEFHVAGREIYWLCRKRQSESTFSNAALERALRLPSTLRGRSTLQKLVAKYRP